MRKKLENHFSKSLDRIEKQVEPQDDWMEDDWEHYRTIIEALEKCADLTNGA